GTSDDAGFLIEKCFMKTCRQKSRYFNNFCLSSRPLLSLAFPKAEQNSPKLKKFSTVQPKSVVHGPRQPHKTKSSPFQRRSRDEDDLQKKTPRLGNRGEKGIFIQAA
ncbi:hypothetical protein, partial [Ligilactobacillus ruminis]|uniref:hypothetical protein n=1 Tax=Ligilactobacillus ruminis TaxID=1623 RepID=UPI001F2D5A9B